MPGVDAETCADPCCDDAFRYHLETFVGICLKSERAGVIMKNAEFACIYIYIKKRRVRKTRLDNEREPRIYFRNVRTCNNI